MCSPRMRMGKIGEKIADECNRNIDWGLGKMIEVEVEILLGRIFCSRCEEVEEEKDKKKEERK